MRKRCAAMVLVLGSASVLAGCQKADSVLVTNRCGIDIEVDLSDVVAEGTGFQLLGDAEERDLVQVPEGSSRLYSWIRVAASEDAVDPVELGPSSWKRDDDGNIRLDIVGELCPA
jgi:hypothetical protein